MKKKRTLSKSVTSAVLALVLTLSGIFIAPVTVRADGWPEHAQNLTLGVAVTGTAKAGDFHGPLENKDGNGSEYYWNVYKFTMPQKGLLNVYLESTHKAYFYYGSGFRGFAIFSVSDPDNLVWRSHSNQNRIEPTYSAAREIYHGTADVALEAGEYYFTLRQYETSDVPYFLTLSYKEPDVNVTSISLNKKNIELEPGEQVTLNASVLPENATDKTVVWESSSASVASVENGTVTAKSPGTTTITASSADGEIAASCLVTVIDAAAIDAFVEMRPSINSVSPSVKRATVYFSSVNSSDTKYQIAYKTESGKWKIKNTSSLTTTIRKLQSRKSYAFRVRGYKKFYGKTYYTQWSSVKRATIR